MATGGQKTIRGPLPEVCRNYNNKSGCSHESCEDLHICFYFVTRKCTIRRCTKAHTLETPRNIMLLERMGWSGHDTERALERLRRKICGPTINICIAYNMGNCTADDCRRLHVCHRCVQGGCPLEDCELSHSVTDGGHNARAITAAGMADTPVTELLRLLADHLRQRPYRPTICRAYSRTAGCDPRCRRLHYCAPFMRGQCRFGTECFKGHSLRDPHNQRVLRFFGWTESQALAMLASEDVSSGRDGIEAPPCAGREEQREGSEDGGDEVEVAQSVKADTSPSAQRRTERGSWKSRTAAEISVKQSGENLSRESHAQKNPNERPAEMQRVIEYLEKNREQRKHRGKRRKERLEREEQVMDRHERERQERERQEREQLERERKEREQQERERQESERQKREQQERERQERERQDREQQERERQKREQQERERQERERQAREQHERERQERERQERERQEREQQEREQEREKHRRDILERETREKELLEGYTRLMDKYDSTEKTLAAIKQTNQVYGQQLATMQMLLHESGIREQKLKLEVKEQLEKQDPNRQDSERLRALILKQRECMECSVCLGIFVRPVTLHCSHTFCQACIENAQRTSASCPLCRLPMRTKMRCLVLDRLADTIRECSTEASDID